jgi:DHA1 family tetracycline resistance protein-like MFS transporter
VSALSFVAYGLAPEGWMLYVIIVFGSLSGLATPAIQGLISRSVGADEQGGVQGTLTSVVSVAGIVGPPVATGLFAYFISDVAPRHLPGAAFFFSAGLVVVAIFLARRSFRMVKAREEGEGGEAEELKG